MPRYRMQDGRVVNTDKAVAHWDEDTRWDGNNHISKATATRWDHETLYRSPTGYYYLVHTSQREGTTPYAEWLSTGAAARWLLSQNFDLPPDLAGLDGDGSR